MTPEERAAQIWCKPYMASREMDTELCLLIAAEIRQAVEEELAEKLTMPTEEVHKEQLFYEAQIKAEAYEDAAKIADNEPCTHCDICPKMIGRLIRSRAREVENDLG